MTDKTEVWAHRIHQEAGRTAKSVLDLLVSIDPAGFKAMTKIQREQVHERIGTEVVETMQRLGSFVCAGAQDKIEGTLVSVNIKGTDDIKLTLEPKAGSNVHLVADNAGKQVVVAFVNMLAYQQARDELIKAVHREQTDWVAQAHEDELTAEAEAEVSVTAQATGEVTEGEQHGETKEADPSEAGTEGEAGDGDLEGVGAGAGHAGADSEGSPGAAGTAAGPAG